jgi:hypothetical protein
MRIVKVPSKSNPSIYREVRIKENLDGSLSYECSCPANVWFRVSNGRHGKQICSHIKFVIDRGL